MSDDGLSDSAHVSARPWFPWYPADFDAKTRHLTRFEVSVYRDMLDRSWMRAYPGCERGELPTDARTVAAMISRFGDDPVELVAAVAHVLSLFWPDGRNSRLFEESQKSEAVSKARSEARTGTIAIQAADNCQSIVPSIDNQLSTHARARHSHSHSHSHKAQSTSTGEQEKISRKRAPTLDSSPIPEPLASMPAFVEAWTRRLKMLGEKPKARRPTPTALEAQLKLCAERPAEAVALVEASIVGSWQGLKWEWLLASGNGRPASGRPSTRDQTEAALNKWLEEEEAKDAKAINVRTC